LHPEFQKSRIDRSLVFVFQPRFAMMHSKRWMSTQTVNISGAPNGSLPLRVSTRLQHWKANGACCPACTMVSIVSWSGI
jgi:hypothetical protein